MAAEKKAFDYVNDIWSIAERTPSACRPSSQELQ